MMRLLRTRLHSGTRSAQEGVYAILYAVLVVILLGMAAIVVDFASVRSDRRTLRSATDSAVIGAAALLNPRLGAAATPFNACEKAWDYIELSLKVTRQINTCAKFKNPATPAGTPITITAYCAAATPVEIDDDTTIGNRTFRVAWPIPRTGGSGFLGADIAPGNVTQTFAPGIDGVATGTDKGCDRIGTAVFEDAKFGLGGGIGAKGTTTQVHSVARVDVNGGPSDEVAALNVLNPTDCNTLVKTGGGKIIVGPTLLRGAVFGPGIIAVESAASRRGGPDNCNSTGDAVIVASGSGSSICANGSSLTTCDGGGLIESHALDGPDFAKAYDAGSGLISPLPLVAEGGTNGYEPVTKFYGCNVTRLPCTPPATNYIAQLESAYGSGTPTLYTASQAPYADPYGSSFVNPYPGATAGTFSARTDICDVGNAVVLVIPAGNWFANCPGDMNISGTLVIKGGNLVATHGISVGNSGCFVMNTDVSGCIPTTTNALGQTVFVSSGSGAEITTIPAPVHDAKIFLRAGSISYNGNLAMPQTFVYAMGANGAPLLGNATVSPLWTAPGAGAVDGSDHTTLERDCLVGSVVDPDCMNSRFARTAYWSDFAALRTAPNTFNGQGNLAYVGVFFTPLAYDNFGGGTVGAAAAAQFWADKLNVNGSGTLALSPDARFSFFKPTARIRLIR
jgi:hypothetical protein